MSELRVRTDASVEPGLFAAAVRRPVALGAIFVLLVVVGLIAYARIPLQMLPSGWTAPALWILVPNDGASAQENEERVARPIEDQLRTLSGVERIESWSEEDTVEIEVEFDGDLDMDLAKAEVRDRIERARPQLPGTVDRIYVWSEDSDQMPIAWFGILHPGDSDRGDYLLEEFVVPRLEAVQGVSKIDVWGALQDSVRILLDEERVVAARLDLGQVVQRLSADNFAEPLGDVRDGGREVILRSDMRFRTLDEIADFPIASGVRIRDVGEVRRVKSVRNMLSRIDGSYSYFGVATKDSQSNVVETSRGLRAAIDELERDPRLQEFGFVVFFLQGDLIEESLSQLRQTALWGGVLALVVLFAFLRRARLTLFVAASIPVSALLAIALEYFRGQSFNLLTMTGITLGVGMLVDNSVVVVENIARLRAQGMAPLRAAAVGVREIALAVTLATLTTVVVFLPLVFMTGDPMLRVLFGGIGIPLCTSLLASLLVAVVFLPVVTARILGERPPRAASRFLAAAGRLPVALAAALVAAVRGTWHAALVLVHRVERVLVRALAPLRLALVAAALALAWLGVRRAREAADAAAELAPFGLADAGVAGAAAFVPALLVAALALLGLPRWRRRAALPPARPARLRPASPTLVDMLVDGNRALLRWTIEHRLAAVGAAALAFATIAVPISRLELAAFGNDPSGDALAFRVVLDADFTLAEAAEELAPYERFLEERRERWGFAHWSNRFDERGARLAMYWDQRIQRDRIEELRRELDATLPRIAGHRLRLYDEEEATARSTHTARFRLTGPDSDVLDRLGLEAAEILARVPGLSGVTTPLEDAPEQVRVSIDRDLAHGLGVSAEAVQNTVSYVLRGWPLPRFQEEGREVPFLIEYDEEEIAGLSTLRDLGVWSGDGLVPLSSFASMSFGRAPRSIYRREGRTSFEITARVDDPLRALEITERAHAALARMDLPRGYALDTEDSALERQQEEFDELLRVFVFSVVLVFLLMGILFESLLLPFSVLFTVPYAAAGALWTLLLTGRPMDSMGWIGIIILAGVVVNNGIVLIDRVHNLVVAGVPRAEAVLEGASQRVRPILMTALTTVFGLVPMIVARPSDDGIDYRSLATIVAGGLVASTVFTLWVVPLAYTLLDDLGKTVRARVAWWTRSPAAPRTRVPSGT